MFSSIRYVLFVLNTKESKRINTVRLIMVPHFKLFSICSIQTYLGVQPISATPLASLRLAPTMLCICLVIIMWPQLVCTRTFLCGGPLKQVHLLARGQRVYTGIQTTHVVYTSQWRELCSQFHVPFCWCETLKCLKYHSGLFCYFYTLYYFY